LNRFSMPVACISDPSSTPWILRLNLFTMSQSSYMMYSCVLISFFMIVCIQ
jgi:hypothetical protein